MAASFFEQPILNSPYEAPRFHHPLDADGQPIDAPPVAGRRRSELTTPVPKPRNRPGRERQTTMALGDARGVSDAEQEYNPTPVINEIRSLVESWRALPNPADWGVTPTTARLLAYWRSYGFHGVKPFFCQIEAVETIVWLTEVAPKFSRGRVILANIAAANAASNPELYRLAMKMATGPLTVESLSPHRVAPADEEELIDFLEADEGARRRLHKAMPPTDFAEMTLEHLRTAGVHQSEKRDSIRFTALTPWPGEYVAAEGRFMEGEQKAEGPSTQIERRAAIFIGPEFGSVSRVDLAAAAREAVEARFDALIACAFAFDAHASEVTKLGPLPRRASSSATPIFSARTIRIRA